MYLHVSVLVYDDDGTASRRRQRFVGCYYHRWARASEGGTEAVQGWMGAMPLVAMTIWVQEPGPLSWIYLFTGDPHVQAPKRAKELTKQPSASLVYPYRRRGMCFWRGRAAREVPGVRCAGGQSARRYVLCRSWCGATRWWTSAHLHSVRPLPHLEKQSITHLQHVDPFRPARFGSVCLVRNHGSTRPDKQI